MNLKLPTVLTDLTGTTGLKIVRSILAGVRDWPLIATIAARLLRAELVAWLTGNYRAEHLFALGQNFAAFEFHLRRNFRALQKVYRAVERYWHKMRCSRSWKGGIGWATYHQIRAQSPLLRPKLYLPYRELQAIAAL
jgi:hypothetical protein